MTSERNLSLGGMQIIVVAMAGGILAFGVVVLVLGSRMGPHADIAKTLVPVLALVAAGEAGAYLVLRTVFDKQARQQLEAAADQQAAQARALPIFQTLVLIRSAMAESMGLFGLVIVMVSGVKLVFLAPGLAIALLLLGFPTQDKLDAFVAKATGRNPYSA